MHPDFLLDGLTGEQLTDWEIYDRLEPIGGFRQDYRFAQLCLLLFNIAQGFGDGKKKLKATAWDFMPWGPKAPVVVEEKQSVAEMKDIMLAMASKKKGN